MIYYNEHKEQVMIALGADRNGLSVDEANKRLLSDGKNKLIESKKKSIVRRFLEQIIDPMIIVLLVAAALSAITSIYEGESFADVIIILAVVLLNSILGVLQESKAEKAIDALKEMTSPQSKVLRNGIISLIRSEDIVVGDTIVIEAGDSIPADCRIIEAASLKIEESALTGESLPVTKITEAIQSDSVPLGDRKNMCYMGSTVVYGRGIAVVTAIGMNTEMGKIATAISNSVDEKTPLQVKLAQLSKILTVMVLAICVVIFAYGVISSGSFAPSVMIDTFMLAVSLAVAAIPEGLVAVVTIVLSIGVTKMSKRNAVIRKLTAVETLGCTQIICSDKTGTLTQNRMTVVEAITSDVDMLAKALSLCSDAEWENEHAVGEPTECALVAYAAGLNLPKSTLKTKYPRLTEAPFDSMRKMMSTVHSDNGNIIQFTKGAPDELLKKCTRIYIDKEERELTEDDRARILRDNKNMADRALRVLAGAYKKYNTLPDSCESDVLENELVFIGLVGMIDPIRPEVKNAVDECHTAGIRVIMITGDHKDTAVAIAKDLGIISNESEAISGSALDTMSDDELREKVTLYNVYARVQPEHKVRIVSAWKSLGMITAMTGDGVNDAPSIKSADIGIGMGITGTDVTKNVADMILADDNFATIAAAVEEGRKIYANICKSIQFLLSSNLSEVISIFTATVLGFTILRPAHMLWINLITDSLPALALSMEKNESNTMTQPPRSSKESIFANGLGFGVCYQGFLIAAITVLSYVVGHRMESGIWEFANSPDGITMAFLTLSMAEIFHSFNMRSQRSSVFTLKNNNLYLFGSGLLAIILTFAVTNIPFLTTLFGFTPVSVSEYLVAIGLALSIIPLVEIIKAIERLIHSKSK